jgi:hypothetical protein
MRIGMLLVARVALQQALRTSFRDAHDDLPSYLVRQRHFRWPYKHEAQASEQVTSKPTRLRFVLVFMAKKNAKVALSI